MTKAPHIRNHFVGLASVVTSFLEGAVLTWRRWAITAAVVAFQTRSSADIILHAVQDRFGAATSFVDDSGQLWAWSATRSRAPASLEQRSRSDPVPPATVICGSWIRPARER